MKETVFCDFGLRQSTLQLASWLGLNAEEHHPSLAIAEGAHEEIYVINDDITLEKPLEEYYVELNVRLESLRNHLGDEAEYLPSTYEKYVSTSLGGPGTLQRNVREYYNELKLLRNDTQVGLLSLQSSSTNALSF